MVAPTSDHIPVDAWKIGLEPDVFSVPIKDNRVDELGTLI